GGTASEERLDARVGAGRGEQCRSARRGTHLALVNWTSWGGSPERRRPGHRPRQGGLQQSGDQLRDRVALDLLVVLPGEGHHLGARRRGPNLLGALLLFLLDSLPLGAERCRPRRALGLHLLLEPLGVGTEPRHGSRPSP